MRFAASAAAALVFAGTTANAQTLDDLKNDGKNTDNILTYGMGYHQQRYCPLDKINKTTVRRLVPVWNAARGSVWTFALMPD